MWIHVNKSSVPIVIIVQFICDSNDEASDNNESQLFPVHYLLCVFTDHRYTIFESSRVSILNAHERKRPRFLFFFVLAVFPWKSNILCIRIHLAIQHLLNKFF